MSSRNIPVTIDVDSRPRAPLRLQRHVDLARLLLSRPAPGQRLAFTLGGALAAVAALTMAYWPSASFLFPLDDAYITIHNALSLLSGKDANYVGVNPLTGATSLVHLALVAVACLLVSPVAASYGAGLLGLGIYAMALATMVFQRGGSRGAASVIVALGLFGGFMPLHLLNGLETGWAVAAVTLAIVLADRPSPTRWLPVLCGILPFVRPELGVLAVLLMARQVLVRWEGRDTARGAFAALAADVASAAAAASPWLAWSFCETGAFLPNTAGAKVAFFAEAPSPYGEHVMRLLWALASAGLLPSLVALFLARTDSLTLVLRAFVIIILGLFAWRFPGGMAQNYFRYAMILVPLGLYGLVRMVGTRADLVGRLVLLASLASGVAYVPSLLSAAAAGAQASAEMPLVADWAAGHLPADATVLVHDAGYLSFATRLRLVDIVGLKTPDAVLTHQALTWPSGGADRARAISLVATRHAVTHAVILDDETRYWSRIGDDLRREGWRLSLLWSSGHPNAYAVYKLTPPVAR